ncbi:MAG: carbamoyltransferase HypF [Lachnospiraceae bacterium]|nr:carbamoyltransferase HypF [Lachnospiraceae bacterium]MBR5916826.1 carbamoyltransferase HypF [Lachnospiraceae bacterium]
MENILNTCIIRVYGIVQGVGFRPFVSRTCLENNIKGTVANKGSYVEIHAQGENIEALFDALNHRPPKRSVILEIIKKYEDEEPFDAFTIIESEKDPGEIFVSPDIAICDECKKELYTPTDKRFMHPFINCTNCGPRLTILDSMPYDRVRTSMGEFEMCDYCHNEYVSPSSRRYDAQPVCCNECGPEYYLLDKSILSEVPKNSEESFIKYAKAKGRDAITAARKAIIDGKIVAVKGIGGFHLACDATNEEAVKRLRVLKTRPAKPFAVMMRSLETVLKYCEVKKEQEELLCGHQKPIVLLTKKDGCSDLAESLAPGNPTLGVMLPYAPIQLLLFDYNDDLSMPDALVMTSGNASGAPICRTDSDALNEISSFTDYILSNNRKIRLRCDDTVTDFFEGKPYMIRRSRGFAPLPVMVSSKVRGHVLAIGGELKNTFCIAKDSMLYPSAYIGDMEDLRSVEALKASITRMETLLEASPALAVCDLHPLYHTTEVAETLNLPLIKVQHHYAHILSCMAENNYLDDVIGVSFDGTGYGTDGTIWGGEILKCSVHDFERITSVAPFIQSGGDISAKEGWRIAASILRDTSENGKDIALRLNLCSEIEFNLLSQMASKNINSVKSTSAGRIFDAVSAILNIKRSSTFEGEASTSLMFAAQKYEKENPDISFMSDIGLIKDNVLNTNELVLNIAERYLNGEDKEKLAYYFHDMLSSMIVKQCVLSSEITGIKTVALSGGVYQNILLLKLTKEKLKKENLNVIHHSIIPPNDGGIALGQALYGLYHLNN